MTLHIFVTFALLAQKTLRTHKSARSDKLCLFFKRWCRVFHIKLIVNHLEALESGRFLWIPTINCRVKNILPWDPILISCRWRRGVILARFDEYLASVISDRRSLPLQEAFRVSYWRLLSNGNKILGNTRFMHLKQGSSTSFRVGATFTLITLLDARLWEQFVSNPVTVFLNVTELPLLLQTCHATNSSNKVNHYRGNLTLLLLD